MIEGSRGQRAATSYRNQLARVDDTVVVEVIPLDNRLGRVGTRRKAFAGEKRDSALNLQIVYG